MTVAETATLTTPRRPLLRRIVIGFPQVIIVLAVIIFFGSRLGEGRDIERQWFHLFRTLVIIGAATLIGLWALFFSGWRKLHVVTAIAVIVGGSWALFRIEYDGNLRPHIHFRDWVLRLFGASHSDKVRAHREHQARTLTKRPVDPTPLPTDFPGFRGADRTGIVDGPPLNRDWSARPPREIWKQPIYGGYSAFAVVNEFLYTMEQRNDDEAVVCYDAVNGNELWSHSWPARFVESMGGVGPRSTPTVDNGEVFAFGAFGRLVCLNAVTGEVKWAVDALHGRENLQWAMSGSPLVYGDFVVVNPGSQPPSRSGYSLVAYHRRDGHIIWTSGKHQAGYASPMLVTLSGQRQILLFDGAGLGGYDPETGAELWRFPWITQGAQGINVAQPIVLEKQTLPPASFAVLSGGLGLRSGIERKGEVFIASGYSRGGALVRIAKDGMEWKAEEVWRAPRSTMRCKFSSPVEHNGFIYGLDDGNLQCIDLADGNVKWTDKRRPTEGKAHGNGQILRVGDALLILSEYGEVILVEANSERFRELGRLKVLEGDKTWNNPALAGGLLYIRNHREMACVDLR
jgi:outer membrane protein assembly factor BamB